MLKLLPAETGKKARFEMSANVERNDSGPKTTSGDESNSDISQWLCLLRLSRMSSKLLGKGQGSGC